MDQSNQGQNIKDLKKFALIVLHRWYLVLGSLMIALTIGYLINRYAVSIYSVGFSIVKIPEQSQGLFSRQSPVYKPYWARDASDVQREIRLIKSKTNIENALKRLDFQVSITAQGDIKGAEVYRNAPFEVVIDSSSSRVPYHQSIIIGPLDSKSYRLKGEAEKTKNKLLSAIEGPIYNFDEPQDVEGFQFTVLLKDPIVILDKNQEYSFRVYMMESLIMMYMARVVVMPDMESNNIFSIRLSTGSPQKDLDFMTEFSRTLIEKNLQDKNLEATNSLEFINTQLDLIADTLSYYQSRIDNFNLRMAPKGTTLEETGYSTERIKLLQENKSRLIIFNNYLDYLQEYLKENRDGEVFAPVVIGVEAPILNQLVLEYIDLKKQAKIFGNIENVKNPIIQYEDGLIGRLEKNILESIANQKGENSRQLNEIDNQVAFYLRTLEGFQEDSRELYRIQQMRSINEQVISLLLQRKTEVNIQKASTRSDYEVLDDPGISPIPIHPDKNRNFAIAGLLGLGIPIGILYLLMLSNKKVLDKDDLDPVGDIPFLGVLGHNESDSNLVVVNKPKSALAESFRSIRANLNFLNKNKAKGVFLVTSSISSEGKTFCSANLAQVFALSQKKTVLIVADLRKPKLFGEFNASNNVGLSNYLSEANDLESIIQPTGINNLDFIAGGPVPPNPSELLMGPRLDLLISELKKMYDYVLFDSPPIGVVSDADSLIRACDVTIYVIRQSVTPKQYLTLLRERVDKGVWNSIGILFNDLRKKSPGYGYGYGNGYGHGYGYGYGYGYYEEDSKKPKSKNLIKRIVKS